MCALPKNPGISVDRSGPLIPWYSPLDSPIAMALGVELISGIDSVIRNCRRFEKPTMKRAAARRIRAK
jgi:hypothetical protein